MSRVISIRLSDYDFEALCRAVDDYNRMQPAGGLWPPVTRSDIVRRALLQWILPWMEVADNGKD